MKIARSSGGKQRHQSSMAWHQRKWRKSAIMKKRQQLACSNGRHGENSVSSAKHRRVKHRNHGAVA